MIEEKSMQSKNEVEKVKETHKEDQEKMML